MKSKILWVLILVGICFAISSVLAQSGEGEEPAAEKPRREVHLTVWTLPQPGDTTVMGKCDLAIIKRFREKYPWITLSCPTGLSIPEMGEWDTRSLMAIAGGVSPDVIYVNFRQADTYIREGFLYPLDEWVEKLPKEELDERLPPQVKKVIYRWGPGKKTGEDPNKHYWALPYEPIFTGLLWRKAFFQQVGLDPERPPTNWDEFYEYAQRCTDPDKGTYGILWGKGADWSSRFFSLLSSAGATVMQDFGEDDWHVTFNSPEAVVAYEFVLKLVQGKFRKPDGRIVEGVAYRGEYMGGEYLWIEGRIGMREMYLADDWLLDSTNMEQMGLSPVPKGPSGLSAAELNCFMNGIFSGAAKKGRDVLEAAWLYVHFRACPEAMEIKTRIIVENGCGLFANPFYLEKLGYYDVLRRIPPAWRETLKVATENAEPEPYGRNTQTVFKYMTEPADKLLLENVGNWVFDAVEKGREDIRKSDPDISEERLQAELKKVEEQTSKRVRERIKEALDEAALKAEQEMIGIIPPSEMRKRRIVAAVIAVTIFAAFALLFRHVIRVFTPPGAKGGWMFRKYWLAYVLLIPAVGSIALWQYFPLVWGAMMAFQDYHLVLATTWIGLDHFANVLWDPNFWNALWVTVKYVFLSILMGFFTPVALAILLHEIPKGKMLFRTIYYLPAVISGMVVMIMWKNFFDPTGRGLFNQILTAVSPREMAVIGAIFTGFLAVGSHFNFKNGRRVAGPLLGALAVLCAVGFIFIVKGMAGKTLAAQRWLEDPKSALFCVILPTVWAGMGPGCLIYLAALKTIPEDFYEAADIDGAGFFAKIWHITLPTIKVLIVIQFIGAFIGAFQTSGYVLVMTAGGPNRTTEVLALKIFYDAFVHLRFGIATATAWMLGFMLIGFTVFQLRRLSKVEFKTAG